MLASAVKVSGGQAGGEAHALHRGAVVVRVLEDRDFVGGGQDALLQKGRPQQRVDDAALATVELADNDEQERLIQACSRAPRSSRTATTRLSRDSAVHAPTTQTFTYLQP